MKTITVMIGNSDNKLSQQEWAKFVEQILCEVRGYCREVHFSGGSSYDSPWQNACFVGVIEPDELALLRKHITRKREMFLQSSVAIVVGETEFI